MGVEHDAVLLARAGAGDEHAMGELYAAHRGKAHGVALRVLRDHALAEDAVQEGFLALWRAADSFDGRRASVAGWLCVLVHRRACDLARRAARRYALDSSQEPPADSYTAEEVALLRDDQRRVHSALDQLSTAQRELVELAYWGGLTQSQLACRLGVPLGTIKSRTFEALRQLRVVLAEAA